MTEEQLETIWQKAVEEKSWKSLVPYPRLRFRWQVRYPQDAIKVATVSSHKLGQHKWCETPEKCKTVEKFIQDNSSLHQQSLIDSYTDI